MMNLDNLDNSLAFFFFLNDPDILDDPHFFKMMLIFGIHVTKYLMKINQQTIKHSKTKNNGNRRPHSNQTFYSLDK